jgi:hypothetical protein
MNQALRHAIRSSVSHPSFTLMAVTMLALGIGTTAAIFSVVNAVVLRPLPYPNEDRLVWVWSMDTRRSVQQWASYADFRDWQGRSGALELLTGWGTNEMTLAGPEPQRICAGIVMGGFFELLGARPMLGTNIRIEGQSAPTWQVVLSHDFWQSRFNSATDVVGQALTMSDQRYTVVGVASRDFRFPVDAPPIDVWVLLGRDQFNPAVRERRDARMFEVIGRACRCDARAGAGGNGRHRRRSRPAVSGDEPRGRRTGRFGERTDGGEVLDHPAAPDGSGGMRAAHRVRERDQPSACTSRRPAARTRRSDGAWGQQDAVGWSAASRERAARLCRRHARRFSGELDGARPGAARPG